ncbi:enhanced serine sensitivity protein SseB C-terminal domain-containing protein [Rhizorhabdus dicambivorans]|uniref:SseB protein N-terminal domain-containing protein n=1 Tax=Rhizorhabdus dicambivorans TaxID=1850238 RepID=A0A2A4FZ01_9SPHN|nr:enhanced serine sensitivity protein SseB C-terminal domain-containing protein [Rhizorhabdus dicambivorans]ATE63244.1 hypothetical protein CMV14_01555 [Rhizorhabdus dicambivorans]PCE43456.1 hypothetical protein COO09_03875 [Rhizorhabdus dicambivorans]
MIRFLSRLFGRDPDDAPAPIQADEVGDARPPVPAAAPLPGFEPQNRLEELLVAAAHDPERRTAFNRALLESTLFAASPDLPASRGMALPLAVDAPRLIQVGSAEGHGLPALFTSQARLFATIGNGLGYFAADGARLLAIAADRGAWLNPGLGYGVQWTPTDIAALLGRPAERRRAEDVQLLVGAPSDPPDALIAALREALAGDPAIARAWLGLAQWPGREELAWYLDVRTTLGRGEIERRLEPVFRDADLAGRALDLVVMPLDGGEGAGIPLLGDAG